MKTTIILLTILILIAITGCTSHSGHEHSDDDEHEHSVEISGSEIKQLAIQQIADLWEIDSQKLLNGIIEEFDFKGNYTPQTVLDDMRFEYQFSPAIIKDIAEEIKSNPQGVLNE